MPSKLSYTLQATLFTLFTTTTGFAVWTKHTKFEPMDPSTDPIFALPSYKRFNPNKNPSFYDVAVRRIPITKLDPVLARDAEEGGSKLVERFAQGVWGGFGCTPQRKILEYKYRSDPKFSNQIWTQNQLLTSTYPLGTELINHFNVVDRPDASTIVFRCGDSPLENPELPRLNDGLFEMKATVKQEEGFAEFRLKSVFYQGEGRTEKAPFEGEVVMPWAHRVYAKLWMEVAVGKCRRSLTGDIDWEKVKWGETKKN